MSFGELVPKKKGTKNAHKMLVNLTSVVMTCENAKTFKLLQKRTEQMCQNVSKHCQKQESYLKQKKRTNLK